MEKDSAYWKGKINEALVQKTELNEIDFKEILSENGSRLKEHINAFGHYPGGGAFVFGITRTFHKSSLAKNYEQTISRITRFAKINLWHDF